MLAIGRDFAWQHDDVFVRWFFTLGGIAFLIAALWLRERPGEGAHNVAFTFVLMGIFWTGPQLLIMAKEKWRP